MFELADYLIGIYKVKDCTETVCIRNAPPETENTDPNSEAKEQSEAVKDLSELSTATEVLTETDANVNLSS